MLIKTFKTQDTLTLRVGEDEGVSVGDSAIADPDDSKLDPKTVHSCDKQMTASLQDEGVNPSESRSVQPELEANDPGDLLDIITNPHAAEHEWLSACHKLEKHKRREEQSASRTKSEFTSRKSSRKRILGLVSAAVLSATIGVAAMLHWGPFAPPEINFHPYMVTLTQEIKSHWHPPDGSVTSNVGIHFKIKKNGEISDIGFDRLSRLSTVDAAALQAVIESMPALPPLPPGAPDSVDVNYTFDYHVSHQGTASLPPANKSPL